MRSTGKVWPVFLLLAGVWAQDGPDDTTWVQLWNGDNLEDWDVKFSGHPYNENYNNAFRSVDGNLEVNYDDYNGFSGEPFGHAAYQETFSFYYLRAEYQVWGSQVAGAPEWALQNNGLMLHSQSMESMDRDQEFPNSIEAQLLGPDNSNLATPNSNGTMNLCPQGAYVYDSPTGGNIIRYCRASKPNSRAPINTGWTRVSALVLGDSVFQFFVEGEEVFTFYRSRMNNNAPLTEGYIAIQAESHPYRFRVLELVNLVGCMDSTAANYKSYLVRHDPSSCEIVGIRPASSENALLQFNSREMKMTISGSGEFSLGVYNVRGENVFFQEGMGPGVFNLKESWESGLYFLEMEFQGKRHIRKVLIP